MGVPHLTVRRRLLPMATIAALSLLAACSSGDADPTTTESDGSSAIATLDQPCSPAGRFAETAEGNTAICSGTDAEGNALTTPVWRLAAENAGEESTERQKAAIEIVRQTVAAHPAGGEWPESDETTLLFINDIASAARVASDTGLDPLETFSNLVAGYSGANGVSQEEATAAMTGLLLGVVELFEGETAATYSTEMLTAATEAAGG